MKLIYYVLETFLARGGRDVTAPEKAVMLKFYAKMEVSSWLRRSPISVERRSSKLSFWRNRLCILPGLWTSSWIIGR